MFQARLEDTESRLRRLQDDKDLQMNSIISRSEHLSVCKLETDIIKGQILFTDADNYGHSVVNFMQKKGRDINFTNPKIEKNSNTSKDE